jgi:hypothetical protein
MSSAKLYRQSINNNINFWTTQASEIDWYTFPEEILSQDENGLHRWYKGAKMNTAYLALDKHVNDGFEDRIALIYDSAMLQAPKRSTATATS